MTDQTELLGQLLSIFEPHAVGTGETTEMVFNRQVQERMIGFRLKPNTLIPGIGILRISCTDLQLAEETWTLDQLKVLPQWHNKRTPRRIDLPVVIFRDDAKVCLIDGQNRVNLWCLEAVAKEYPVLVVTPTVRFAAGLIPPPR